MRILLPPSEAKRADGRARRGRAGHLGEAGKTASDGGAPLTAPRAQVAAALVEFCRSDPASAADVLALPARSVTADLAANCALFGAPTMPALDRYAGTVYEGLDAATLTAAGRRRALESVLIFSGLFGVLRGDEHVPVYRLPVAATLPGVGALTPFWRAALGPEMDGLLGDGLLVDLRSSDYSAMWRPTGSTRERHVAVRIVTEQPDGRMAVISYVSKHGKGRLARALLSSRGRITSADHIAERWTDAGGHDAIIRPGGAIDLITPRLEVTAARSSAPA